MLSEHHREKIESALFHVNFDATESSEHVDELLELHPEATSPYQIYLEAKVLHDSGNTAESFEQLEALLSDGPIPTPTFECYARYLCGNLKIAAGRPAEGVSFFQRALEIAYELRDYQAAARIHSDLALSAVQSGDSVEVIAQYEHALLLHTKHGSSNDQRVRTLINLAAAYLRVNRLKDALDTYETLVNDPALKTKIKYDLSVHQNLAVTLKRLHRHDESLREYQYVLDNAREHKDVLLEAHALIGIADHYVIKKNVPDARATISQALKLMSNPQAAHLRSEVQAHMANISHAEGDLGLAIAGLEEAFTRVISDGDIQSALLYGKDLAAWQAEHDDHRQAYATMTKLAELQDKITQKEVDRAVQLAQIRSQFDAETRLINLRDEERSKLLDSVMPSTIAARLMSGEEHIADRIQHACILFADIVGFTNMASSKEPEELVDLLEHLFTKMDEIAREHGCQRVKTIGDAYMAMCVPDPDLPDPVERIANVALAFTDGANDLPLENSRLRIGINTGPVVAGVMRGSRMAYDVWGDTVNVASRMEELSEPGKILVTESIAASLESNDSFDLIQREPLDVRGKGLLTTYWLTARR